MCCKVRICTAKSIFLYIHYELLVQLRVLHTITNSSFLLLLLVKLFVILQSIGIIVIKSGQFSTYSCRCSSGHIILIFNSVDESLEYLHGLGYHPCPLIFITISLLTLKSLKFFVWFFLTTIIFDEIVHIYIASK